MNTDLAKTFEEEFLSFFSLYLANLVFAALSMAIGLMIVVQQVLIRPGTSPAGMPGNPVPRVAGTRVYRGCARVHLDYGDREAPEKREGCTEFL